MKRPAILILVCLVLVLAACDGDGTSAVDLSATADALSLGQAQLQIVRRQQTATAQALAARATIEAKATRAAIDQENATSTAEAKRTAQAQAEEVHQTAAAQSASTATVAAHVFELTSTADALSVSQRIAEATATADAQTIIQAHERQSATATAAAVDWIRVQAEQDALQARQVSAITAWLAPAALMLFTLAIVALLYRLASQWIAAHNERWKLDNQRLALMGTLLETRTGTVVFVGDPRAGYTPRLLGAGHSSPGDEFASSQVGSAPAIETIQVNTPTGTTFIPREDPAAAQREAERRLALRLLREAMKREGPNAQRIPGYRDLSWPSETWTRAVKLLKPHVKTKPGRGGGTVLAAEWSTLQQLYVAVGERRTPLPGSSASTSP